MLFTSAKDSAYQIIYPSCPTESLKYAAEELKAYIFKISGAMLPYFQDSRHTQEKEIIVGYTNRGGYTEEEKAELGKEGFIIKTEGEKIYILGSEVRGALYGVYAFLEEYRKIRLVDSADVKKNRFAFSGRCSEPTEAFILFDDKSSISFILSANDLTAEIGKNSYIVTGSSDNEHLSRLMMQQHRAVNERIRLQKVYKKMQTDSTLTKEAEDSLLNCYRSLSVDLRKNVEATLADTTRPLLVRQTRRLLSFTLAPDTIK